MAAYVWCGRKKLGVEFAFAMASYFFTASSTIFLTLREDLETLAFYLISLYLFVIYWGVACSDPGRLSED